MRAYWHVSSGFTVVSGTTSCCGSGAASGRHMNVEFWKIWTDVVPNAESWARIGTVPRALLPSRDTWTEPCDSTSCKPLAAVSVHYVIAESPVDSAVTVTDTPQQ